MNIYCLNKVSVKNILEEWQMKSTNENISLHKTTEDLKTPDLEPFLVHVTESYSRNVVVYAESSDMAKALADKLCEEGLLLLDFDNFADRNIETLRKAKETDFVVFQAFGPENFPESLHIPLKDRIQNVKENANHQSEKNIKNTDLIL